MSVGERMLTVEPLISPLNVVLSLINDIPSIGGEFNDNDIGLARL